MLKRMLAVLVGVAGLVGGLCGGAYACDETSSKLVARSFVLTMPLLDRDNEMIPLMQYYPAHFASEGGAIQCMWRLGTALIQAGAAMFEEYDATHDIPYLPPETGDSMSCFGCDAVMMGEELHWLAQVLPYAAQGNYGPYSAGETTTRQRMAEVLSRCRIYPPACELNRNILSALAPWIEQRVYVLARQLGN